MNRRTLLQGTIAGVLGLLARDVASAAEASVSIAEFSDQGKRLRVADLTKVFGLTLPEHKHE